MFRREERASKVHVLIICSVRTSVFLRIVNNEDRSVKTSKNTYVRIYIVTVNT